MLALAILLSQVPDTPGQVALRMFQGDLNVFETDEKNFGLRRIPPMKVGAHFVSGYWPNGAYRFLAGNLTKRPTAADIRVQYVQRHGKYQAQRPDGTIVKVPADAAPKDLSAAHVKKLLKTHFGREFQEASGKYEVFGYKVPAGEKCLSCHTWAKAGDTLGYLVYGVEKQ